MLAILLGLLLGAAPLAADRVTLHTGEVYTGKIVSHDAAKIVIETAFARMTLWKSNVREAVYETDEKDWSRPTGALWRSALLPGWGQFYADRDAWGCVYSGLMLGGLVATLVAWNRYDDARDYYLSRVHTDANLDRVNSRKSTYNAFLVGTLALWIWQAADAFLFTSPESAKPVAVSLAPLPGDGGMLFAALRF